MLRRPSVSPFAVLAVALLLILSARPILADSDCEPVDLDHIGCGELLMRGDAGLIPLPAVGTDVRLDVNGPLIAGTVTQRFVNPTDRVIEAVYVFPLSERAAVHAMEMWVGERRIVSIVQEKAEARRTRAATETMFLVDVSGSMQGAFIEQARTALLRALNAFLEPAPDDVTRAPRRRRSHGPGGSPRFLGSLPGRPAPGRPPDPGDGHG